MARQNREDRILFRSLRQFREHYFPKAEAERMRQDGTAPVASQGTGLAEEAVRRIRDRLAKEPVPRWLR